MPGQRAQRGPNFGEDGEPDTQAHINRFLQVVALFTKTTVPPIVR